jgi:hypothetical protein
MDEMPCMLLMREAQVCNVLEALTSAVELSEAQDEDMRGKPGYYSSEDLADAQACTARLRETLEMFREVADHSHEQD